VNRPTPTAPVSLDVARWVLDPSLPGSVATKWQRCPLSRPQLHSSHTRWSPTFFFPGKLSAAKRGLVAYDGRQGESPRLECINNCSGPALFFPGRLSSAGAALPSSNKGAAWPASGRPSRESAERRHGSMDAADWQQKHHSDVGRGAV